MIKKPADIDDEEVPALTEHLVGGCFDPRLIPG